MKKLFSIFFILFAVEIYAQDELAFEFDYARFKYDTSSVYVEFYYDLMPSKMTATEDLQIEAIVHVEIKDANADTIFFKRDWKIANTIDTANSLKSYTGVVGMVMPEGKYSLYIKAYDANKPSFYKEIRETIEAIPFTNDKYALSDIQIATNIKREGANPNSIFYKNTLEVIPNPSMIFSNKMPVLFYYAELYNLKLEDPQADFTLYKELFNGIGNKVGGQSRKIAQNDKPTVDIGFFNLSKLPTDSYTLKLSLVDNKTNQGYISSKRFYYYNPDFVDTTTHYRINRGFAGSEFAIMNAEDCDKMFDQIKYIASGNEINQYKKLDSLNGKREFLFTFWQRRDPDPSTPVNEFKEDYMRRVEYVNQNFSYYSRPGYLTDRGRVYLVYGEPDQRDRYPNQSNMKPYEVWFYNQIEGGVTFIFGDVTGFGNYELLHSDKRGEVRDDNWQYRLRTTQ
ncbi:Hypothetical protein MROS_0283 [Melioribacter roseus P3M-2]|uniref:GWxTD domain-containing protein n=1 Tax=Melioribacter roseus (strain DSM 23840 / JCM 17771 / VKM B-2668 / P3M-2) TaxID=1191523 RepID=I6YSL0_MELRP|nr:GWxTD domain-containing protein [Melioribacter roseus]AFN73527.1 Hypothetical protein MROS_0283 [Melioribacter roseus P3M-2]